MINSKIKTTGKWAKFTKRMSGLTSPKITKHIEHTIKETRSNFKIRDLSQIVD